MEVVTRITGEWCHTVRPFKLLKADTALCMIIEFGAIEDTCHHLKHHVCGATALRSPVGIKFI